MGIYSNVLNVNVEIFFFQIQYKVWHNLPFILLFLVAHLPSENLEEILTHFYNTAKATHFLISTVQPLQKGEPAWVETSYILP